MKKQQVLREFLGENLPLVFSFANRYAKPFRKTDPDYVNEIANLAVIRTLECADYWDPERCAPSTFVIWQVRAVVSRLAFYRLKKMAPCRTASRAELELGEIESKPDQSIQGPEIVEREELLGHVRQVFDQVGEILSEPQRAAIRNVIQKGMPRRSYASKIRVHKNAVDQNVKRGLATLRENRRVQKLAEYLK